MGFPMEHYKPTKNHKYKRDLIDKFLDEVYPTQKEFMLNLWAYYIQHPEQRTGRLVVVTGTEGSGKTTLFHIMECIIGQTLCKKTNDIEAYLSKFNMAFRAKKVIWLDDIHALNYKQVRKLMPKATSRTEEYEPKGLPRQQVTEVSELWLSGNQESPILTTAHSRRDLIFQSNDTWLGKRDRFIALYKLMDNRNVAWSWFTFLKNRDISKFHPRFDQPDISVRQGANEVSMPPVIAFLSDFFATDWIDTYPKRFATMSSDPSTEIMQLNYDCIKFNANASVTVVYHLFAHWVNSWVKENMPNRRKLSKRDIITQMKELNFVTSRNTHREDRREAYALNFPPVRDYVAKHYGIDIEPWWHDVNRETARDRVSIFLG